MTRTSDAKAKTIGAAFRLFRQRGYHGTALHDILDAGGAPRGSLYFHFPGGKEEIAVQALAAAGKGGAKRIAATASRAAGLDDFIAKSIAALADELKKSDFIDGCPVAGVALDTSGQSLALGQAASAAFSAWETEWRSALISFGVAEDAAKVAAAAILAQLEGALLLARTQRSLDPIRNAEWAIKKLASHTPADASTDGLD